jgi:hypothetical protein
LGKKSGGRAKSQSQQVPVVVHQVDELHEEVEIGFSAENYEL